MTHWDSMVQFPRYVRWKHRDIERIRRAYPRLKALRLVARELKGLRVRIPVKKAPNRYFDIRTQEEKRSTSPARYHAISRKHLIDAFQVAEMTHRGFFFGVGDLFYDREIKQLVTIVGVQRSGVHIELLNQPNKFYLTYTDFTPPRFILIESSDPYSTRNDQLAEMTRKVLVSRKAISMTHVQKKKGKGIGNITQGATRYKP